MSVGYRPVFVFTVKSVRNFDFQAFEHSHLLEWFVWGLET